MRNILLLLFIHTAFSASGQNAMLTSKWVAEEVKIDGLGSEWELPLIFNDEKVSYSLANDGENLNLLIQSFNRSVQQKIMRSGMTVFLSTTGKNKKKITVFFPMKSVVSANTERLSPDSVGNPPTTDQRTLMRNQFVKRSTEMKVKGIDGIKGAIPITNEFGVLAAIDWESENLLTYELKIPIKELIVSGNPADFSDTPIDMKIQVHAMPQPNAPVKASSGRGGRGGRGGGRSGPPQGAQGVNRSAMFTPDVYKAKFILSYSEE